MKSNWMTGIFFLWLILEFASTTIEGSYVGSDTATLFDTLIIPKWAEYTNKLEAIGGYIVWGKDLVVALIGILSWDFIYFAGENNPYSILRFPLSCLSIVMVIKIGQMIRGGGGG